MTAPATPHRHGAFSIIRFGHAVMQSVIGLFAAGSVIFAAHSLFLRYYAREWTGIQLAGVNGCVGEDRIANGDLFEGKTFCNQPINFVPWVELYRRHWQASLGYYTVIIVLLIVIGWVFIAMQRRLGSTAPFGQSSPLPAPADSEHLR